MNGAGILSSVFGGNVRVRCRHAVWERQNSVVIAGTVIAEQQCMVLFWFLRDSCLLSW